MTQVAEALFEVRDVAPNIGAVIRADKETLLSGAKASAIREIMERRGVIVFPEINLSDDEQIAFTHTLGTFAHEDGEGAGGKDTVYPITMDETINPIANYLKGAFYWHLDGTMSDKPILASIMSSRALSAPGTGQTEFCNTYAAWDALPEDEKAELETLKVFHAVWRSQLYWHPEPSYELLTQWKSRGQNRLPLVWKHRSGRKSLVLGATALQVEGMDWIESEDLLVRLRDWATQPQFVYRHEWKLGDMVIWDNTGTMHRALPYDHKSGRLMHRTKLEGEESFV
jgi:alpha-ketoglutarate-dependent taurine dioxygenase